MLIPGRRARRLRPLRLLALLLMGAACAATQPDTTLARSSTITYLPAVVAAPPVDLLERQAVELTNQERLRNGCSVPLAVSPQLSAAARGHSQDMAANNFFGHTGSDGSTLADRLQRAGYPYRRAAENIAAGYATASDVVASWMRSAGHRANILNCELREIGIGYYADDGDQPNVLNDDGTLGGPYFFYWTQDFGVR